MDEQGLSYSDVDYMQDIEEIHFGSTSDEEEDEDEPRLRIDTSDDDDTALDDGSSSKRQSDDSSTNGHSDSRMDGKNSNPLQSLQQLVHSPFLNAQISATDGGNLGCNFNPINDRSKSIVNLDAASIEMIRSCAINFDAKPSSTSRPYPRSRKSSEESYSSMNFQRLSPVSIEVVPSLPHLLPPQTTTKKSDMSSRLNYVVNRLRTSATEEQHLRHLQKLRQQSSPEAEDFKMFQQFLKSGQFQARCNSNNLEVLPASGTNLINIMNKGFRYNSINAQTRSTFAPYGMPPLRFKDFGSRMPPALTVIPKNNCMPPKRTNCRRSPPPMVPIESIANFRKPLNEDNVVYRLKKLGTDIELERSSTKMSDEMPPLSVERVKTPVTSSDKASLPFLKPIPEDRSNSVVLTKLHPPPPSLIPIKPATRFVPILPNLGAGPSTQGEITVVPVNKLKKKGIVMKRKKKNRLTAKSEYTRLAHALVQAATPLNAPRSDSVKVPISENRSEAMDRPELTAEVTIEPIQSRDLDEKSVDSEPVDAVEEPEMTTTEACVDDKKHFVFHPSQAIQVGVLPNGRKMLSCDICSGVYHKMYSLKKHYYRSHINPKFISEKHAAMFKVLPPTDELIANPKCQSALYWCSICECLFDEKNDLSSHLTDHPPLALEAANKNSRLYLCDHCNMVFPKKRTQVRHSKKCANTRTAKAPPPETVESVIEESSNESAKNDDVEIEEAPKNGKLETSMMCLFCELSFTDTTKRKKHVLQHHHPKRKQQPCVYCKNKTFSDLSDLLKHICEMHSKRYFGCAICKIRFRTKEDLVAHNAESHETEQTEQEKEDDKAKTTSSVVANKNGKNYKCNQCPKVFSNTVEMGRHKKAAHRDPSRNNIKKVVSAFSAPNDNEQKYRSTIITTADYETEFYKNVCGNVKYNLENCMEGRVEMKKCDYENSGDQSEYADLQLNGEDKEPVPLSFQDMYGTEDIDSRFIHNVSRLHLATQLTMLRKANMLDKELDSPLHGSVNEGSSTLATQLTMMRKANKVVKELDGPLHSSVNDRNSTLASRLALAEKPEGGDDEAKNEANDSSNEPVFSGEWIRARNYICGTCFARFNNFWDMEDHRWIRHPNVWGFYYEFVTDQAPGSNWAMKRTLQSHGIMGTQATTPMPISSTCTKCQKVITPMAEFHKHILECGGDTTWTSMMFAAHTKRNKKWKAYGGRRKKNIARHRGLKRNIPTTPVKIIGPPKNRQKAGDTETIQRMIANLPPKRITRRVITFDDIEAKSKSRSNSNAQQSSMLTRKRKESMDTRGNNAPSTSRALQESKQNVATSQTLIGTKNNTPYNKTHHRSRTEHVSRACKALALEPKKESIDDKIEAVEVQPQATPESSIANESSTAAGKVTQKSKQVQVEPNTMTIESNSSESKETQTKSKQVQEEPSTVVDESTIKAQSKSKQVQAEPSAVTVESNSSTKATQSKSKPALEPSAVTSESGTSTSKGTQAKSKQVQVEPSAVTSESGTSASKGTQAKSKQVQAEPSNESSICAAKATQPKPSAPLVESTSDVQAAKSESIQDEQKVEMPKDESAKKSASKAQTTADAEISSSKATKGKAPKSQTESEPVEKVSLPSRSKNKIRSSPESETNASKQSDDPVVVTKTSKKGKSASSKAQAEIQPEPVPVVSVETETDSESQHERKSSRDEEKAQVSTSSEPKTKSKSLVIKIQSKRKKNLVKSKPADKPVNILKLDKKRKKKCTPVVRRFANETTKKDRKTDPVELKPEIKDEPVAIEPLVEPVKESVVDDEPPKLEKMTDKLTEPEEGEIDLESAIEPADEDSPALPDTSVILAAMKETMRQTDAVISSMPTTVTPTKKRKHDKCKKCGVKSDTATCEVCAESPAKKTKPAQVVPKIESSTCKICRSTITGKARDEMCDKCSTPKRPEKSKKSKAKETRPIPPPFRCRKCDTICVAPADGSLFCEKCSRLQETVCLLCKSSYISDTNDKVCGKCMLAGSSKQKKRSIENDTTPAVLTTSVEVNSDGVTVKVEDSKNKKTCERCKKETDQGKCTCSKKRKTSIQDNRSIPEISCETCGKKYKDDDKCGSSTCRSCRQTHEIKGSESSKTDTSTAASEEEIKCIDCSSITQNAEATKKCDACSSRKDRRSSNESTTKAAGVQVSGSPGAFSGFADELSNRSRLEEPKIEPNKEEASHCASTDHKTPMKNVKLICRGCYGVFDTVSSYKYHCDNCKHRSNEKKPLLSFAKRNTKGSTEPTSQTDSNGASFEILEGVQIKFLETPTDKTEAGKETPSQIPLVVYESDSSPMKKTDANRTPKKNKRTHSSPETIMDTIESVIKSVCHDNQDLIVTNDDEPAPSAGTSEEVAQEHLEKVRDVLENNLETEEASKEPHTELEFEAEAEPKKSRGKKAKANPKARKKASKKAKKTTPKVEEPETDEQSVMETSHEDIADSNESKDVTATEIPVESKDVPVTSPSEEFNEKKDVRKPTKKIAMRRLLPSNDMETMKNAIISSRLRARPRSDTYAPPRRALRSRTKLSESLDESKNIELDEIEPEMEELVVKDEPMDEGEKITPSKSKKRKNDSPKSDAKKPKNDNTNDLGFNVTKTNKIVPKNASKKNSIESKNQKPEDEAEPEMSAEETKSESKPPSRRTSDVIEPVAPATSPLERLRRRSSDHSEASQPESTSASCIPKENRSRRNSAVTVSSMELQNESIPFFGDRSPQSTNELAECSQNEISTFDYDEQDEQSYTESFDSPESVAQPANSWAWDFLDQKSLGSILDTVNEILSRPEVSSCSSDSVDSFREEMMMFQHFGREISAIEKQDDESMKQDEETTTIIDLDELSKSDSNKMKEKSDKVPSEAGSTCSSSFNEECDICDQSFPEAAALQSHMSNVHGNDLNKNMKDSKLKLPNKVNQNGMKSTKHRCSHCQKVLQSKAETLMHMKEHWKSFALSKSDNGSHLKNSIADKLEELLLDKALVNYLKSPQETQHRNNLPLKILNQISLAKKNQFTNWKSALAQVLDMDSSNLPSTSATPPASTPVETTPVVAEPATVEKTKTSSNESNAEAVEGYPCPMCNKTFQYTRTRNTHLIMVHAPRQSTHKHLIESSTDSKKEEKNKSSKETSESVRNEAAREKIFHSYLLNDSVNTVVKKDSLDEPSTSKISTSTSTASTIDVKKSDRSALSKPDLPSCSSSSTTSAVKPKASAGVAVKPAGEDDRSKKKKPCRKKMSKKEMNLPAAIVKLKAEQALLQLCNSRFNRICSQ